MTGASNVASHSEHNNNNNNNTNQSITHYFIVRPKVNHRAGQLSLPHIGMTKIGNK